MTEDQKQLVDDFLANVRNEIYRAIDKYPQPNPNTAALAGEAGEACEAMVKKDFHEVYMEAVQTACVAARLAIEGDPTLDEYRTKKGLDKSGVI